MAQTSGGHSVYKYRSLTDPSTLGKVLPRDPYLSFSRLNLTPEVLNDQRPLLEKSIRGLCGVPSTVDFIDAPNEAERNKILNNLCYTRSAVMNRLYRDKDTPAEAKQSIEKDDYWLFAGSRWGQEWNLRVIHDTLEENSFYKVKYNVLTKPYGSLKNALKVSIDSLNEAWNDMADEVAALDRTTQDLYFVSLINWADSHELGWRGICKNNLDDILGDYPLIPFSLQGMRPYSNILILQMPQTRRSIEAIFNLPKDTDFFEEGMDRATKRKTLYDMTSFAQFRALKETAQVKKKGGRNEMEQELALETYLSSKQYATFRLNIYENLLDEFSQKLNLSVLFSTYASTHEAIGSQRRDMERVHDAATTKETLGVFANLYAEFHHRNWVGVALTFNNA